MGCKDRDREEGGRLGGRLTDIPASSFTMALPIGWVAPITIHTNPYSFPSLR